MELPALKVGKPRPTPVVRGGITKLFVIIIIAIIISGGLWAVCFMSGKMDTHKTEEQVQYINAWKCKKMERKNG